MSAAPKAPRFNGARVVAIRSGTPFLHKLAVSGERPLAFTAQDLSAGLTLDGATGIISGSLPADGESLVAVTASNASGSASAELKIVVGDTLALTPPMGWNSYDSFDDSVSEAEALAQAAFLRDHLQPFGWDLVVVDFRWYDPDAPESDQGVESSRLVHDANGRLQPSPNRFPSSAGGKGFKALADKVHAMGLKFGIHIMRGIPRLAVNADSPIAGSTFSARDAARGSSENGYTCVWNADMYGVKGDTAAGQAWYDSIFAQYAEWGVDFVKVDDATKNRPENLLEYFHTEVEAIQNAIHASGRSMVLSLSPGESLKNAAPHLTQWANMWRMSDDFWDRSGDLDHMFDLAVRWQEVGGSGHWPDADMLPLGKLGPRCPINGQSRNTAFTKNEQLTMMSLWAILPSPYFLGSNLVESGQDSWWLALVQNDEIIAIHQDSAGRKAKRIAHDATSSVWTRALSDGRTVVGFFNLHASSDRVMSLHVAELGITEKRLVRDPWQRTDRPAVTATDALVVEVPNRGGVVLVLSPEAPPRC